MRLSSDLSSIDESLSWTLGVHDSKGSSPYSRAETRVESLKLPNSKEKKTGAGNHPSQSAMRYIFEARSYSPKLLPDNIKGDAKRILRSHPGPGYSTRSAAQRIPTSGKGEKIRLLKQKKHSYLAPRVAKNLPKDKGKKGRVLESPRYPRDVMPALCLGTVLMVRVIHLSGLQWIDSSDRGRSCKDERWQQTLRKSQQQPSRYRYSQGYSP